MRDTRAKTEYSEREAAEEIGITVQELRDVIRRHFGDPQAENGAPIVDVLQPSDLVLLRLLAGRQAGCSNDRGNIARTTESGVT